MGNRSSELEWDGRDEYGDRVGKGRVFLQIDCYCSRQVEKREN